MVKELKAALVKSAKDPTYFWYFLQNVHPIRDHFPRLFRFLRRRKCLNLGSKSNLNKLHVILRTTDFVMNTNSTRQLEDIGIKSRIDVIRIGGCSIFAAAKEYAAKYGESSLRITLVTDRLSAVGMMQYKEAAMRVGLTFDVIESKGCGNGPSFQTQVDVALKDDDDTVVLILEDDYLLEIDALSNCFAVMQDRSNVIGMNPHFHPDRVRRQDIGLLSLFGNKLYSQIFNTCCTFFITAKAARCFEKKLRRYDGWEDGSINCIWKQGICLAPLGWTMAEHLHRCDLSPVQKLVDSCS